MVNKSSFQYIWEKSDFFATPRNVSKLMEINTSVIHSIFVLGPSALGMEESYLWQLNLRNLRYNKKLSRDVGINKIGICSNYIQLPQ